MTNELHPNAKLLVVFVELIVQVGDRIERVACETPAPPKD
jgi:hypothetical protein